MMNARDIIRLDTFEDHVLDLLDSHVPSDFMHYESEELPLDVLDLLDQYEREVITNYGR